MLLLEDTELSCVAELRHEEGRETSFSPLTWSGFLEIEEDMSKRCRVKRQRGTSRVLRVDGFWRIPRIRCNLSMATLCWKLRLLPAPSVVCVSLFLYSLPVYLRTNSASTDKLNCRRTCAKGYGRCDWTRSKRALIGWKPQPIGPIPSFGRWYRLTTVSRTCQKILHARIQIFHHAARRGGCSWALEGLGGGGEGGGVPPHHRSLHWLGQHQIRPSRGANEWRRRCKRRRRLFKNGRTERSAHNQTAAPICTEMENKVTNFSGKWKMKSSENFEELLKALGDNKQQPKICESVGVNVFLRKIAVAAASSPAVEITQQGETLSIKTSTSVRTTNVTFTVGQSFNEATVDGRPCTSFPKWETDRKISCEQTLPKGDGLKTAWTRELTNDGELILTMTAGDVVCTR
ncbi:hypothetical protein CCH79_00008668, partial [Gambusia affinis]